MVVINWILMIRHKSNLSPLLIFSLAGMLLTGTNVIPANALPPVIHLSDSSIASSFPEIAVAQGSDNVYAAWTGLIEETFTSDIFFSTASDGTSFNSPVNISQDAGESSGVQIVGSGSSDVFVVWQNFDLTSSVGNIFFASSTDGGACFDTGAEECEPKNISPGSVSALNPRMAVSDSGDVYVVWQDFTDNNEIFFAAKPSDSDEFGTPKNISNNGGSSDAPQIAMSSNGTIFVVWQDNTDGEYDILFASSTDGGDSFGNVKNVNHMISESTAANNVRLAAFDTSTVYVVWEDLTSDFSNLIFFASSTDGGACFDTGAEECEPKNISPGSVSALNPRMAVSDSGDVYVVWQDFTDNNEIFFATKPSDSDEFGTPKNISNNAGVSSGPVVDTTTGSGTNHVYVVWADLLTDNFEIYVLSSTDGGESFGCPVNLSTNDASSFSPRVAISDGGTFYVTWHDSPLSGNSEVVVQSSSEPITCSITIDPIANQTPKWGEEFKVSGSVVNPDFGDSVTIDWGDGSDPTTAVSISSDGEWGPVSHPASGAYASSAIATNPNHLVAKLVASNGMIKGTSSTIDINVQKRDTALTLFVPSIKVESNVTASGLMKDAISKQPISGKTVNFEGFGVTGLADATTDTDGKFTSVATSASNTPGDGLTVKASFNGTLDGEYNSSESPSIRFDVVEATATEFTISEGSDVQKNITISDFQAYLTFEQVEQEGKVYVSETTTCNEGSGSRYVTFESGSNPCLRISSAVQMASGSVANITISFAGKVPLVGYSDDDIDLFHIEHDASTGSDTIVDVTGARDLDEETVTGIATSFSKFVAAPSLHSAKESGGHRQQIFIGDNNIVSLRDVLNGEEAQVGASFDKNEYFEDDSPILTIRDQDANVDPKEMDIVKAGIKSKSSAPFYIIITLTETGIDTGNFTGTFTLTSGDTNDLLHLLHVETDDTLEVSYIPGVRFSANIDGVSEAGIIESRDVIPLIDCFTFVGGAGNVKFVDSHLGSDGKITMSISYANAKFQPGDAISNLKVIYSQEFTTGIIGAWNALSSTVHENNQTVTAVLPLPSNPSDRALYSGGSFSLGFESGCKGGAGGGLGRPGAGIVVDFVASIKRPSSPPTESGGSSGGSSRTVIVTNQPSTPTFPASYFAENPLARLQVKNVGFIDSAGASIFQTTVGQQLSIASTFTNHQQASQHYSFIIMILDEEGLTIDISSQDGTVESGQTVDLSSSWMSQDGGVYTIKVFIWDSIGTHPVPLSEVSAKNIRVVSS